MQGPLVHTQITTKKFNLLLIFRLIVYIKYLERERERETDRISQREILQKAG
jgi:hypothetical protein